MELNRIGQYLQDLQDGGTVCVVTDTNVAPLYLARCVESLQKAGYRTSEYILEAGEASKNGTNYLALLEHLAQIPMTRSDGIVALGGGMVGDLAGFTAATYMRGIKVYQVPTTLLAAVDSSVGGKTAIDLAGGKNLAGAFHQPALVLQDVSLLASQPAEIRREGMAEVIKYGAIEDEELFEKLRDPEWTWANLEEVIETCVSIKKSYVEEDEFDHGLRHMLNFGHTLGHAIEHLNQYGMRHGDAVAVGMYWMTDISVKQGWCEPDALPRMKEILDAYGFDLTIPDDTQSIYRALCSDKKRENDRIALVALDRIGQSRIRSMDIGEVEGIL